MKLTDVKKLVKNVGKKLSETNNSLYSVVKNVFKDNTEVKEIFNNSSNGATVQGEYTGKIGKDLIGIKRTTAMYRKTTLDDVHPLVLNFYNKDNKVMCDINVNVVWTEYTNPNKEEVVTKHNKMLLLETVEVNGDGSSTKKSTVKKETKKAKTIEDRIIAKMKKIKPTIEKFVDTVSNMNQTLLSVMLLDEIIKELSEFTICEKNDYFFKLRYKKGNKKLDDVLIRFRSEVELAIEQALQMCIQLHNENKEIPQVVIDVLKFGLDTYGRNYDHNWEEVDIYDYECELQMIIDLYGDCDRYTYDDIIEEEGMEHFESVLSKLKNVVVSTDVFGRTIILNATTQLDGQISLDSLVVENKEEQIEEIHMEQSIEKTVIEKEPTAEVNPLGIVQQKKEIYDYMFNELKLEKIVKKEIGFGSYLYTEGYEINGYKIKHNHLDTLGGYDLKYVDEFYDSYVYNSMKLKELYYKLKDKFDIVPHTQTVGGINNKKLVITHLEITKEKQIVNLENLSYIDVDKVHKSVDNYNFKIVYQVKNSLNTDLCYEIKMLEYDKPFTRCRWTPIRDMELGMSKERELIYDFYYRVSNSEIHFEDMQSAWDWYIATEQKNNEDVVVEDVTEENEGATEENEDVVEINEQPTKKVKNKKVLDDIINLSSGTIATLIDNGSYEEIDKTQREFYEIVSKADVVFLDWQSAWSYYKERKEEDEMLKSRLHEIIDEKLNKYAQKINKEIKDLTVLELDEFVKNVLMKDYVHSSLNKANGALTYNLKQIYGIEYRCTINYDDAKTNTEGIYTIREIEKIIDKCVNPQDKFIIYALFKGINGTRADDLLSIKVEDVDFKEKTIELKNKTIVMDDYMVRLIKDAIGQKEYIKISKTGDVCSNETYLFNDKCPYVIKGKPNSKNNMGKNKYGYEGLRRRLQMLGSDTNSRLSIDTLNRSGILYELNKIKSNWKNSEIKTALKQNGWKGNVELIYNLLIEVYGMEKEKVGGYRRAQ